MFACFAGTTDSTIPVFWRIFRENEVPVYCQVGLIPSTWRVQSEFNPVLTLKMLSMPIALDSLHML